MSLLAGCDETPTRRGSQPELRDLRPLDLNHATVTELEKLPGIGDKLARSIMASRNARGGRFQRIDDLLEIDGIGDKTLAKLRPYLYITP